MRTDYRVELIKYESRDAIYNPATGKGERQIKSQRTVYTNFTIRPSMELAADGHLDARDIAVIRATEPLGDFDAAIVKGKIYQRTGYIEELRASYYLKWTGEYANGESEL